MLELPSQSDIAFFKTNGWFIGNFKLPESVLEEARVAANEFYAGIIDSPLPCSDGIANDTNFPESNLRNNEFVSLQKTKIAALGLHQYVSVTAASLLESPTLRLFADSLITKKNSPNNVDGSVGWHTDKAYWPTCSSHQLLTAWIPLQDVHIDMGPLCVLSKSHLWEQSQTLKSYYGFNRSDLIALEDYLISQQLPIEKQFMTLKAGQVSFHHCDTIHGSPPNISTTDRASLTMHFQGEKNHYQPAYNKHGQRIEISYDKLCRKDEQGYPDYHDPYWFRQLDIRM